MRPCRSNRANALARGPHGDTLSRLRRPGGFTLLEVILAVVLATGILVAMLAFYNNAANLRGQLLLEAERLTAIRLLLDRLAADLRGARVAPGQGFSGEANSLQFVRTELPPLTAWAKAEKGRASGPFTDLWLVSYGVATRMDGTNMTVAGLRRTERPLVQHKVIETRGAAPGTGSPESELKREPEPLTDAVGFLHFRFWDGSGWVSSWGDTALPQGIEVTMGAEPAASGTTPEDYPYEMFRRVVYLPGHNAGQSVFDETAMEEAQPTTEAPP